MYNDRQAQQNNLKQNDIQNIQHSVIMLNQNGIQQSDIKKNDIEIMT
jgi:hypothetical protein